MRDLIIIIFALLLGVFVVSYINEHAQDGELAKQIIRGLSI